MKREECRRSSRMKAKKGSRAKPGAALMRRREPRGVEEEPRVFACCAHCEKKRRQRLRKTKTARVLKRHNGGTVRRVPMPDDDEESSAAFRKDGRKPEDVTEDSIAPMLGVGLAKAKALVEKLRVPIFHTRMIRRATGMKLPTKKRLKVARNGVIRFVRQKANRKRIETAFRIAAKENDLSNLHFAYDKLETRVERAALTKRYRNDFVAGMAMTIHRNQQRKLYPIYVDAQFPLTTKALTSAILHEGLHYFCTRRKGNPLIAEEREHTAMRLLGDKDLSKTGTPRPYKRMTKKR